MRKVEIGHMLLAITRVVNVRPVKLWKCSFGTTVLAATLAMIIMSLTAPVKYLATKQREITHSRFLEENLRSSRWVVTSHLDADDVIDVRGWTILLYGNNENQYCRWPRCILLEDVLGDSRVAPMVQTCRKLAAYIYAISRGAKHICCVEKWNNNVGHFLSSLPYTDRTSGIVLTNFTGQKPQNETELSESLYSQAVPSNFFQQSSTIQRFVVDNDINPSIQFPVHFAGDLGLPVYIPSGLVISLSRNVVVIRYDAFWSLAMQEFGKVSSQFIQKILWMYGASVGAQPMKTSEFEKHFEIIIDKNIDKFSCDECTDIYQCIEKLIQVCRRHGLMRLAPTRLVRSYLETLVNMGYDFPRRKPQNSSKELETVGAFKTSTIDTFPQNTSAQQFIKALCPKVVLSPSQNPIRDIGLIVTFNTANLYENIPGTEAMYRPYFNNIIYCGPNLTHFELTVKTFRIGRYVFIEAFKQSWYYMYECTTEAMKMNLNVNGFLQIGDDTIVNPWTIRRFPRHSFWLHEGLRVRNISTEVKWSFWETGKVVFRKLISDMRNGVFRNEVTVKNFLNQFLNNSANFSNMFFSGCDFMYAPTKFKEVYIKMAQIIKNHGIMVEIAYPTLAMGIQDWESIHFVENGNLIYPNRSRWQTYYTTEKVFMHPFKLGRTLRLFYGHRILCGMYFTHKD